MRRSSKNQDSRNQGRVRHATQAVRSAFRRYPAQLVASLMRPKASAPKPMRDLLTELAPEGLAVTWLGHASVIVGLDDITVAVDPVLSERIGPRVRSKTLGLRRLVPAPIDSGSMKGVDVVLITHAHFDHLDRATLEAIADERTTVIVPPRCARLIPRGFARVIELKPGGDFKVGEVHIRALQPRHWGARLWFDRRRGACAYELGHAGCRVLFAGDTADTDTFNQLGAIDLAVFGIGAYEPWEHMHATPEQVWKMFLASGARYLLPVHYGTFPLSDEPIDEPITRLLAAAGEGQERIIRATPGEIDVVPPLCDPSMGDAGKGLSDA